MLSYGSHLRPQGVARYLAELRQVHSVFRAHNLVHYTHELDMDLVALQSQMDPELPPLIQEPYVSQYALYLETLPRHTVMSHWFGLVLPAMITPDLGALVNGPQVPSEWLVQSTYFNMEDDLWNRSRYIRHLEDLTPLQRSEFVEEFAEVSVRAYCLISLLILSV
jgi:hypothetical protein